VVHDPGIAASTQTYGAYLDAVEAHDVRLTVARAGDTIDVGGAAVTVDVFGPPEPYIEGEARNENSIVLKLTFGATSFLWTGDAEDDQEAHLVDTYGSQLDATVLKAGHHGSATSTSGALLDVVTPEAVVVSSAYDSQYGHPDEATLGRLAQRSIPTYWTGTHGNTVLVSDGQGISVRTQHAAPTDPTALRDGDPAEPGSTGGVTERARLGGSPVAGATTTPAGETSPTPTIADGGTSMVQEGRSLAVAEVSADAAGADRDNLNDEYVVLENTGETTVDLGGWTLTDAADHTYTFPDGVTLAAGEQLTVHTGSGTDTETDLYWGRGSPVWNNDGDTIIIRTTDGTIVVEEQY
jgi:competence protein ComEC